ncbi:MAG: hypothetical protein JWN69_1587, partial [Alphaproteobacteria bacterium]|nr:hypothetical protein [Alphaproteobacteria bacterium]
SYLFGFEALFAGFTLLAVAFRLRSRHAEENASGDRTADSAARDPSGKPEMRHG